MICCCGLIASYKMGRSVLYTLIYTLILTTHLVVV